MQRAYYLNCKRKGLTLDTYHFAEGAKPGELVFDNSLRATENAWKVQYPGCWIALKYRMSGSPGRALSPARIRDTLEPGNHFFSRDTLRFFGQNMGSFRVRWYIKPCAEYSRGIAYLWAPSWGGITARYVVPYFGGYGTYKPTRLYMELEDAKRAYND